MIHCFENIAIPELKERFRKAIEGKPEELHAEIGRKVAMDYNKELQKEHSAFRKSVGATTSKYEDVYSKKSTEINKEHETKLNNLKTEKNAKDIRGDQGQGNQGGKVNEGGENVSSKNIQLDEEQKTGTAETEQQAGKVGGGENVRITHEATENLRSEHGLNERTEYEGETNAALRERVTKKMKSGEINVNDLYEKIDKGEPIGKEGETAMLLHEAKLESELANLDKNSTAFDEKLKEIETHITKAEASGSLAGAQLQSRQQVVGKEDTIGRAMVAEMKAEGVDKLTAAQKEKVISEFEEIKKIKEQLEVENKKLAERNAELEAEAKLKSIPRSKSGTKKTPEQYAKDREAIRKAIADKLAASKGKLSSSVLFGAERYIEVAPDVMKLVGSYVEEGVTKLADVVKKVHADLKDSELTENDIRDIIAGKYDKKRPTRTEASIILKDLKTEQQLINRLEELENGKMPASEKKQRGINREITDLKRKIKEHDTTKLAQYKKKIAGRIVDIQEVIDKNQFAPEKPAVKKLELDESAKQLEDRLAKIEFEREYRREKARYANRTKNEKTLDAITDALNVPRSIMSSADLSAVMRQAVVPTVTHPIIATKAFVKMLDHLANPENYERFLRQVERRPDFDVMQKTKLGLTNSTGKLAAMEEAFMSKLAEKIPILGPIIKASERAYTSYLNQMRVSLWDLGTQLLREAGKTPENNIKAYEGLASWVNNSTGRGGLAGKLELAAPMLNSVFFSPKLMASRLNMLGLSDIATFGHGYYSKLPREIRRQALKDMAKFIGMGVGVLMVANAAGAEVESDPRSTDFGKIKVGNTRYDLWGGFQPYARLFAQLLMKEKKSTRTGEIVDLSSDKFGAPTTEEDFLNFGTGKLSPSTALLYNNLITHHIGPDKKKIVYTLTTDDPKEVAIFDQLKNNFLPLLTSDVGGAYQDGGLRAAAPAAAASILGIGVQTYDASANTKEKKYK